MSYDAGEVHVTQPQVPGKGDHAAAAPSLTERLAGRLLNAKKAVFAFLIGGGGAAIADNLRQLDFSTWTPGQLVQGVITGALSGIAVYFATNRPAP